MCGQAWSAIHLRGALNSLPCTAQEHNCLALQLLDHKAKSALLVHRFRPSHLELHSPCFNTKEAWPRRNGKSGKSLVPGLYKLTRSQLGMRLGNKRKATLIDLYTRSSNLGLTNERFPRIVHTGQFRQMTSHFQLPNCKKGARLKLYITGHVCRCQVQVQVKFESSDCKSVTENKRSFTVKGKQEDI